MKRFCLTLTVLTIIQIISAMADPPPSPNVVLILTDDQGWDDVGFNANPLVDTPCLDSLAGESVRFSNFYVHPVCAPTRASLLTGRHYLRTGVAHVHGGRDYLHPDEVTMAQWFKANGYTTGMWGKWHSGKSTGYLPWERGFDEAYMARLYQHLNGGGELNGKPVETVGWTTDAVTGMAIDFITRHKDQPFLAYVPYLAPHTPLLAPDELVAKYQSRGMGSSLATAYAMIEQVDSGIGRIMTALDELTLRDNTIVIFLSDNGPQYFGTERMSPADYARRSGSGMRGHKGSMWENGIKVPFLVSLPGRFATHTVDRIADVHDILPTLIDLCGLHNAPAGALPFDGRSIVPYLQGHDTLPPKESVIFSNIGWGPVKDEHYEWPDWERREYLPIPEEERANILFSDQLIGLRDERYKLLRHPDYSPGAPAAVANEVLVDLNADPREMVNLLADNEQQRSSAMRDKLEAWFNEVRSGPHAFHIPRFCIGPATTNIVYLHAPLRQSGGVWNGGIWSYDWKIPGDGGEYLVHVTEAGTYSMEIKSRNQAGEPVWLEFLLDGTPIHEAAFSQDNPSLGSITLPAGNHVLSIRRANRPGGTVEGVMLIEFSSL